MYLEFAFRISGYKICRLYHYICLSHIVTQLITSKLSRTVCYW